MRSLTARRGRPLLVVLTALTLAAGGTVAVTLQDEPTAPATPAPSPTGPPARVALLPPAEPGDPAPTTAGIGSVVAAALTDPVLNGGLAVSVVDARTGVEVFAREAGVPLLPASTAKIATAVAALTALQPGDRLTTRVVAGAVPGEVVLVGGGDPTLASGAAEPDYPVPARLPDLAAQVRVAVGPTPVTRVLVDESRYSGERLGPGWTPGYVTQGAVAPVVALMVDGGRLEPGGLRRHSDPALAAGQALAALVAPAAVVERGTAAAGAAVLGEVASPTVAQLVERMLVRSDNDLAEALAREVALVRGQPASFAGVAVALEQVLVEAGFDGVSAEALSLADGSGLSRLTRVTPSAVTHLLAGAVRAGDPALAPLLSGLPVAGFGGTLSDRYREGDSGQPAAGVVRAKTGTLNGVSALAGLVRTADGRLLAFDLTADAVPIGSTRAAEAALDRLAAALAACGCR